MLIREERVDDSDEIEEVIILAFANHRYSNQREYHVINRLREVNSLTV